MVSAYAARIDCILNGARGLEGPCFDLTAAEIWVPTKGRRTAEDVLWRRSKLGLHGEQQAARATDGDLVAHGSPNGDNCRD